MISKIKNILLNIKLWVRKNPVEAALLFLVLTIGAFLRLYRIGDYMTFLGDEGRDVIIVRRLLVLGDPILIGPGTSIGNMYLGPLYYYMMAPALLLANLSPIGPAIQIALLGVLTIFLVWFITKDWFCKDIGGNLLWGAFIAAFFYAIAPIIIIYSRSSWNPNIMPFFSLVCVYSVWKVWQEGKFNWLIILGVSFAFALQSHYLALLLLPTLGIFWIVKLLEIKKDKQELKTFIKKSLLGFLSFAFLMSPLVIFDARHSWRNFTAMKKFFTVRQETVSIKPWSAIPKLIPLGAKITSRIVGGKDLKAGMFIFWILAVLTLWIITLAKKNISKRSLNAFYLVLVWISVSLVGFGLYKQEIYDHYFGFLFAAPFILMGGVSQYLLTNAKKGVKILLIVFLTLLLYVNVKENPFKNEPNRLLSTSQKVAEKIKEEAKGQKFNLAVIAERNYEDGYQYFLEKWNLAVIDIDPQKYQETVTDQLFVVCEMPKEKCDPTHSSKAEVANFGWTKIESEWEISGVTIYKLVHTK